MNIDSLATLANADPGLAQHEKTHLLELLHEKDVQKFLSGAAGAVFSVLLAKYMKLGRTAQFLLGLAGFGIGRLVYDHLNKHHRQFASWNEQTKGYEIKH
jgi:hypothetical protein